MVNIQDYSIFSPFSLQEGQWLSSIPISTKQIGAFVNKLKKATNSAVITALGDSTGASATGWLIKLFRDKIGLSFPSYTVQSRAWSDTDQKYADATTLHQIGTLGVRRFACSGASTDRFFTVPDSAATSPVGDIDVRFKVMIPDVVLGFTLGGKYDTVTNNRSWFVQVNATTGTLSLFFSTDGLAGTQVTRTSTAGLPAQAIGVPVWIRTTLDVDNGAAGHTVNFYYSTDNTNWVAIGAPVVTAGVTSIFDSTVATQFNSRGGAGNTAAAIEYYAFQLFSSLVAGSRPVIDLDTAFWNGYGSNLRAGGSNIAQYTDFVGNTVQIDGTGQTGAMVGSPTLILLNGSVSGQAIAYSNDVTRFPRQTPTPSDLAIINYSHNEVSTVFYRTVYKQLADAIIAKWPDVGIIATAQNPRKSPAANITEHAIRIDQVNALAASQGYGLVDSYNTLAPHMELVSSDGIHPTDIGYDTISNKAYGLFSPWL